MARILKPLTAIALLCFVGTAWSQAKIFARTPGEYTCCVDTNGRRACGDILPHQCVGRAHTVYNRAGLRIREVDAVKTEEEQALAEAQKLAQQQAQQVAENRQRRREAILSAYSSLQEITDKQTLAEADLRKDIAGAKKSIAEAQQRLSALQAKLPPESADPRKSQPIPAELTENIRQEDMSIKYQTQFIRLKQRELDSVSSKYETDRREYQELVGSR